MLVGLIFSVNLNNNVQIVLIRPYKYYCMESLVLKINRKRFLRLLRAMQLLVHPKQLMKYDYDLAKSRKSDNAKI